jgi:hypothetical protein
MLKKLVLFALVATVALSLSACSGNVADHKADCEEYNKNFERGEGPVGCEAVEQMANSLVLRAVNATGRLFTVTKSNLPRTKSPREVA